MIHDTFSNLDKFGYATLSFKLDGEREPRAGVPVWRIRRTNARSAGRRTFMHTKPCKACGSFERRVWNNGCFKCWELEKEK